MSKLFSFKKQKQNKKTDRLDKSTAFSINLHNKVWDCHRLLFKLRKALDVFEFIPQTADIIPWLSTNISVICAQDSLCTLLSKQSTNFDSSSSHRPLSQSQLLTTAGMD